MIKFKTDQSDIEYVCKAEWLRDCDTISNMTDSLRTSDNAEDDEDLVIEIPNCSDSELEKFICLIKQETEYYIHEDYDTFDYFCCLLAKNILELSLSRAPPVWIISFEKSCTLDLLDRLIYISDFLDNQKIIHLLVELKNRKLNLLHLPNKSGQVNIVMV